MFRLWGKQWKDNRLIRDYTYEREADDTRTHMIFDGLHEICMEFDLENPIWLDQNVREFQKSAKTRFGQDCFIETIPFDYLELEIIEEM